MTLTIYKAQSLWRAQMLLFTVVISLPGPPGQVLIFDSVHSPFCIKPICVNMEMRAKNTQPESPDQTTANYPMFLSQSTISYAHSLYKCLQFLQLLLKYLSPLRNTGSKPPIYSYACGISLLVPCMNLCALPPTHLNPVNANLTLLFKAD